MDRLIIKKHAGKFEVIFLEFFEGASILAQVATRKRAEDIMAKYKEDYRTGKELTPFIYDK